jgi:hypothetical protein
MATVEKFRIDVAMNHLLMKASPQPPSRPKEKGERLPDPVFPQLPEKLSDPGPDRPPERRRWTAGQIVRTMRGWLARISHQNRF